MPLGFVCPGGRGGEPTFGFPARQRCTQVALGKGAAGREGPYLSGIYADVLQQKGAL